MFKIKQIVLGSVFIMLAFGIVFNVKPAGAETTAVQKSESKTVISEPDKKLEVTYKNGKLYVFARSVTVGEVFAEIAKQVKIEIKVDEETAKQRMSYLVDNKELKVGIEEILNIIGLRDLAISWKEKAQGSGVKGQGKYEIATVEIRKRNKTEMAKVVEEEEKKREEDYKQKEKAYHDLFKDMGKKGKLEGMLKDYADGKNHINVETYLRQATFKPEEKPLLRVALRDPKYSDITGAITLALTHAVIDKPEESDKEFILEALKERKAQFMIFTLKFIWDERFIPVLIKDVKELHSATAAEILGTRDIKAAIPALEEALLNSKDDEDCTQILHALSCITGLNYYIQNGKLKTTTERPKLAPMVIEPIGGR